MIENYFEDVKTKKKAMQKALKKYVESTEDFYTLTGIQYTDMPKSKGKALGLDDLMADIEELYFDYLKCKNDFDIEYNKCMKDIDKLDNQLYELIIEYNFIDKKKDKEILKALKEYHNMDIAYGTLRNLKSQAKKRFKKVLMTLNDNKLHSITN